MESRKEILKRIKKEESRARGQLFTDTMQPFRQELILEVLLDIRDLLTEAKESDDEEV